MRVVAGPEKKTRVMSEKERLVTAYHEMGHVIVGHYLEHAYLVHKSRSSPAARPSGTRSRCRLRTASSPPRPSSATRWR